MAKLSEQEIQEHLKALTGWKYDGKVLAREFEFANFQEAFAFVTRLALMAEKANHHPDIDIRYNRVRVVLVSHDAGGVTNRDASLAAEIAKL
jgi:4a-hydroxytetrahydrobiopterin dehydratase